MVKQEELAFIKAISKFGLSKALLQVLRKAMAARKRRKALAPGKAKTSNVAACEA